MFFVNKNIQSVDFIQRFLDINTSYEYVALLPSELNFCGFCYFLLEKKKFLTQFNTFARSVGMNRNDYCRAEKGKEKYVHLVILKRETYNGTIHNGYDTECGGY